MRKLFVITTIIILLAFLFSSCSDEPNAVGIGLLPSGDVLKIDSVNVMATSDTSFLFRNSGSSPKLMLGNYDNGTGKRMKAKMLLQYGGFLSIPPGFVIDSAVLKITSDYRFGNPSGTYGFTIHEMQRSWSEATFTSDSANVPGTFQIVADTSYLKSISTNDSVFTIRLDTLVKDWVRAANNLPFGIIFIPDSISTNTILGFRNEDATTAAQLTIVYHDTGDTGSLVLLPLQSMFVAEGDIPSSSNLRYIQSGISFRELIRFDSLTSAVPARAIITQAILEIAVDTTASIMNGYSRDSMIVSLVRENVEPYKTLALGTLLEPASAGSQKVYRSDIKNIVQQWVTNHPNYGIVLRSYNEIASFDRFALYGANASVTLRPKLKIMYTLLP